MRILYVGPAHGTAQQRADALRRLGHRVHVLNPRALVPRKRWLERWTWKTGALGLEGFLRRRLLARLPNEEFELAFVDGGELIGSRTVDGLRTRCGRVISYNADDGFGRRDGHRFRLYLQAVPHYDLVVVVREVNVAEAAERGARRILRIFRSADEVAHAPRLLADADLSRWPDGVVFIGTWMPERGAFMEKLLRRHVPLAIFGDGWRKAPEWPAIRMAWRGPSIYGQDYVKAIRRARACLGLLSKGNRDLHTRRSMEIPFAGGLLCAERTSEHAVLYQEREEAVFWSDANECAEWCEQLVRDEMRRSRIAESGRHRCVANGHLNEPILARIVEEAQRS